MDPSIMKLLEDDEDETMHSGADLEAFTAALNRDIGRGEGDVSPPPESGAGTSSQQDDSVLGQLLGKQEENLSQPKPEENDQQQQEPQSHEQHSSQGEHTEQQSGTADQHPKSSDQPEEELSHAELPQQQQTQSQQTMEPFAENNQVEIAEKKCASSQKDNKVSEPENQAQYPPKQTDQQTQSSDQANNPRRFKCPPISFYALLPILRPHLDKDRSMQLNNVFSKLKSNEISKDDFLRVIRNIVGDQMLRQAVHKVLQQQAQALSAQNSLSNQNLQQAHPQPSSQQLPGHQSFSQVHAFSSAQSQSVQGSSDVTSLITKKGGMNSKVMEGPSEGPRAHGPQFSSSMVTVKQETETIKPQNHSQSQLPPASFEMHGRTMGGYITHQFQKPSVSSAATYQKSHTQDSQQRQGVISSAQSGATRPLNLVNISKFELQSATTDTRRLQGTMTSTHMPDPTVFPPDPGMQMRTQTQTANSSILAGQNAKTPPTKKPSVGQKKPLDMQSASMPLASKKQKVSGAFQDQSIEQLNDVTAVSGVNLREEEEQLLTAPKEDSRAYEDIRKAVQEEEEKLILQRNPLNKKVSEIMSRCGVENAGSDVERCLSMCVEERLRGLISNLIRLSKQRVDFEKPRHRIVFTSDIRREVMSINQKAKEELDRKLSEEAEKLKKLNEIEGVPGGDSEKEKDDGRSKIPKVNKDEDDKMRATAANVAARAAVGGDDMLSKWQQMAEQARQKREGGPVALSVPPLVKPVRKPSSGRISKDGQGDRKGGGAISAGTIRKLGRSALMTQHLNVARSISVKDVIVALQREPQMSKSTLLYRLHEKIAGDPVAD